MTLAPLTSLGLVSSHTNLLATGQRRYVIKRGLCFAPAKHNRSRRIPCTIVCPNPYEEFLSLPLHRTVGHEAPARFTSPASLGFIASMRRVRGGNGGVKLGSFHSLCSPPPPPAPLQSP